MNAIPLPIGRFFKVNFLYFRPHSAIVEKQDLFCCIVTGNGPGDTTKITQLDTGAEQNILIESAMFSEEGVTNGYVKKRVKEITKDEAEKYARRALDELSNESEAAKRAFKRARNAEKRLRLAIATLLTPV